MSRRLSYLSFVFLFATTTGFGSHPAKAQDSPSMPLLEIRDWFALGSGCRSIPDSPRDVHYTMTRDLSGPHRYRILVSFDHYGLHDAGTDEQAPAAYAQECGLRFGLYPNKGYTLANATARYTYQVERAPEADVRLRGRLFLGKAELDQHEHWLKDGDATSLSRAAILASTNPASAFDGLRCEEPKIVGLDVSLATVRERGDVPVLASLSGDRLEIFIDLKPCEDSLTEK